MIAMWGSRRAGKTSFLVALYYDILQRRTAAEERLRAAGESSETIEKRAGWSMLGRSNAAHKLILEGYERFASKNFPELTDPGANIEALRFEITCPFSDARDAAPKRGGFFDRIRGAVDKLREGNMDHRTIHLDLFDPSGEFFRDPNRLMADRSDTAVACQNLLANSAGMILVIDPDREDGMDYFPIVYRNIINLSKLMNGDSGGPLPIPVAICVTKADQHPPAFDDPEGFLRTRMGAPAFTTLTDFCKPRRFFAVSAVGRGNVEKHDSVYYPLGLPKPENVFAPVEWLAKQV